MLDHLGRPGGGAQECHMTNHLIMTYSFVLHTALKVMEAEWALHVQQQEKEKRKKEECSERPATAEQTELHKREEQEPRREEWQRADAKNATAACLQYLCDSNQPPAHVPKAGLIPLIYFSLLLGSPHMLENVWPSMQSMQAILSEATSRQDPNNFLLPMTRLHCVFRHD